MVRVGRLVRGRWFESNWLGFYAVDHPAKSTLNDALYKEVGLLNGDCHDFKQISS